MQTVDVTPPVLKIRVNTHDYKLCATTLLAGLRRCRRSKTGKVEIILQVLGPDSTDWIKEFLIRLRATIKKWGELEDKNLSLACAQSSLSTSYGDRTYLISLQTTVT
jgi:hypothetical protein